MWKKSVPVEHYLEQMDFDFLGSQKSKARQHRAGGANSRGQTIFTVKMV